MTTNDLTRNAEAKKKYLDLYYECVRIGRLPMAGLCRCLRDDPILKLFAPDRECMASGFWGYFTEFYLEPQYTQDVDEDLSWKLKFEFNPLRQNIVLLMAAMNNEL